MNQIMDNLEILVESSWKSDFKCRLTQKNTCKSEAVFFRSIKVTENKVCGLHSKEYYQFGTLVTSGLFGITRKSSFCSFAQYVGRRYRDIISHEHWRCGCDVLGDYLAMIRASRENESYCSKLIKVTQVFSWCGLVFSLLTRDRLIFVLLMAVVCYTVSF